MYQVPPSSLSLMTSCSRSCCHKCIKLKTYGEEISACCLLKFRQVAPKRVDDQALRHVVLAVLCR